MSDAQALYGKPWAEREYIIVLHHYLQHRKEPKYANAPFIKSVADLIGRTPGAVAMRMENFASIDPVVSSERVGLTNINKLGIRIFNEWIDRPDSLSDCAGVLLREARAKGQPTLFDPSPIQIPKAFGHYEIVDQVGEGGFGGVFSCIEIESNQIYALKILRADRLNDPESLSRFRREIKVLKSIEHPNVIKIKQDNLDSEKNFPAFVMDYASTSLFDYLHDKHAGKLKKELPVLDPEEAIVVIQSVLSGLAALHENQPSVIHRDINPSNILLAQGRWVLADFGLAKFSSSSAAAKGTFYTTTRHGVGTQNYTAPEQYFNFLATDCRADVYSAGMLIWELFTKFGPPMDYRDLGLATELAKIVERATDRNVDARFGSVSELRAAFDSAIEV